MVTTVSDTPTADIKAPTAQTTTPAAVTGTLPRMSEAFPSGMENAYIPIT
jgi:hypothetical protein